MQNGGGRICNLNFIKGLFDIELEDGARIGNMNKVSSASKINYHDVVFRLGAKTNLNANHQLDMTDSITIGNNSLIAGTQTQIWTHSFLIPKSKGRRVRVDSPVTIGDNCYVGSRCSIMPGVNISDNITVGAQTCVSKSLKEEGLYVSQPLRFIEFDADEKLNSFGDSIANGYIYRKQ